MNTVENAGGVQNDFGDLVNYNKERRTMSKQDVIEFQGIVTDLLPESRCMVELENGHKVLCYTAGKLKKFKIRMLVGDAVTVEMTPYDLTKGRITFRGKKRK